MMILQLRAALLAVVSAFALCLAARATAATNVSPGISQTNAIVPAEGTICALAGTCYFGVKRAARAWLLQQPTTRVTVTCERGQ